MPPIAGYSLTIRRPRLRTVRCVCVTCRRLLCAAHNPRCVSRECLRASAYTRRGNWLIPFPARAEPCTQFRLCCVSRASSVRSLASSRRSSPPACARHLHLLHHLHHLHHHHPHHHHHYRHRRLFPLLPPPLFSVAGSRCFAPLVGGQHLSIGRSRDVVMAGRSRRSSTELEPDLSTPTAPKKSKQSEEKSFDKPSAEHLTEVESTETPSTSEVSLQAEVVLVEEAEEEEKQLSGVAKQAGTSERRVSTDETKSTTEQKDPKTSERKEDIATTSTEAIPGTSKEGQLGTLKSIVMKYSEQSEHELSRAKSETTVQSFTLREHASYEDLSLIGNGAYGTVYKAKDKSSGQIVALKKVRVPLTDDGLPMSTLREIAALKSLERYEHPNIVRLLDVCQGDYLHLPSGDGEQSERLDRGLTLWLVFEHVERDLASYIANYRDSSPQSRIPSNIVRQMSREILCGVEFLHSHRIIHRDLKPQNLLVTRERRIKIADFGLAKTYDFEMRLTSVVVTQWYRAPEVLLGCSYATPVDVWSVGCILAELCKLEPLFPGTSEGDQLDRIFQVLGTPSQQAWPENVSLSWTAFPYRQPKPLGAIIPDLNEHGLDLIRSMLMFDPHSRITAAQAVRHRYITEEDVQ